MMGVEAWIVLGTVCCAIALLIATSWSAEFIFLSALFFLIIIGSLPVEEGLAGFSNEGVLTVAALYVVATGLKETGAVHLLISLFLGKTRTLGIAQARIMAPVMVTSAFLNNTPVVASFIPALQDWAQKNGIAVSKLLIPLSYAAIFGGACTLIGTSTNLVVNGLLIAEKSTQPLELFDPAWVGLPLGLLGFVYMLVFGRKLLPDRSSGMDSFKDPREYTIEMMVEPESSLVGKSIEEAGLRQLPGLFLVEIVRDDQIMPAVAPDVRLRGNDRLIFAGVVDSILDLQQINGLQPATEQVFKLDAPRRERRLVEAVVSPTHPLNGQTIKEGRFRNNYDAVVLAVARNGERVKEKVGDIQLRTGDTLLLEAEPHFADRYRNSKDFFLVSSIADSSLPNHSKRWLALGILAGMVIIASTGILSMFQAAIVAAFAMIISKCCSLDEARKGVDLSVLLVIASTLGIGKALELSGAADTLAGDIISLSGNSPYLALAITYLVTWLLTELVTNNAAAVLIFPIALTMSGAFGVSYLPFVMIIIFAASASLSTPIGYQTNLMVYGPGGYRFTDFTRIGLPLNLLFAAVATIITPLIWPF